MCRLGRLGQVLRLLDRLGPGAASGLGHRLHQAAGAVTFEDHQTNDATHLGEPLVRWEVDVIALPSPRLDGSSLSGVAAIDRVRVAGVRQRDSQTSPRLRGGRS